MRQQLQKWGVCWCKRKTRAKDDYNWLEALCAMEGSIHKLGATQESKGVQSGRSIRIWSCSQNRWRASICMVGTTRTGARNRLFFTLPMGTHKTKLNLIANHTHPLPMRNVEPTNHTHPYPLIPNFKYSRIWCKISIT
jgi:hypothetical protein